MARKSAYGFIVRVCDLTFNRLSFLNVSLTGRAARQHGKPINSAQQMSGIGKCCQTLGARFYSDAPST